MGFISKLVHVSVDALLVSTALAGIKKSTGWTLKTNDLSEDKDIQGYVGKYLYCGEYVLDQATQFMSKYPKYFEKPNKD